MSPTRVALVGTRGFGARHLHELAEWHADGRISLVALVDRHFDDAAKESAPDTRLSDDLRSVIIEERVDTVVISAPPHTHFHYAQMALELGASVYLEKPPVSRLSELRELQRVAKSLRVDVGFQQARGTLMALEDALSTYDIGSVERISAYGVLQREAAYFTRSDWAGRWFYQGKPIFDGPLFNACAHLLHAAFLIACRFQGDWSPGKVEAECYSLRGNSGDDLTGLRVHPADKGPAVLALATHAGDAVVEPAFTVHGSCGSIKIRHRDGAATVVMDGGETIRLNPTAEAPNALAQAVFNPRDKPDPYLSLAAVEPFVAVVEQVVTGVGSPIDICTYAVATGQEEHEQVTLPGIAEEILACVDSGQLFNEVTLPWTSKPVVMDLKSK